MKVIDSTGIIIKKEKLAILESTFNYPELVLEDIAPFPGYYDHFHIPVTEKELPQKFVFIVLRSYNLFDDDFVVRIADSIRSKRNVEFDACIGQLYFYNELKSCIRIRLNNYEILPGLIQDFTDEGIQFAKFKSVKPYDSIIKIKKHMNLYEIEEGIFEHPVKKEVHYISIPNTMDWDAFEKLTLSIKQNSEYKIFDAALASVYARDKMLDMVRIYDKTCSIEKLQFLKDKYEKEILRFS